MKTVAKYYLAEAYDNTQFNAAVVRKDNEKILLAKGFQALQFRDTTEGSRLIKMKRLVKTLQMAFSIPRNSVVVFHFPLLAIAYKWLLRILNWRGIRTVALIIDLDGIRDKDEVLFKKEINLLQQFSFIIGHNEAMNKKLRQYLPAATIFSIDVFDYPLSGSLQPRQLSASACYAGNIAKAGFVYSLGMVKGCRFYVYGAGYDAAKNQQAFVHKGIIQPAELPSALDGSFGLVWDGDHLEQCDEYLRWNNPHKFSLYLAAGLPVIVWRESALADFVQQQHIGFTINSISEIPGKIKAISAIEYETMNRQAMQLGEKIRQGFFLSTVMDKIPH